MDKRFATRWKEASELPLGYAGRIRSLVRHASLSGLSILQPVPSAPFLRLLFCHFVFDDQVGHFDRIIASLRQIGRFVDTATAIDMLQGRRAVDGRCFHLSFDDGFANICRNAVPVLVRHQVPAALFVPTAFVSAAYDQVRHYCLTVTRYRAVIEMSTWDQLRAVADLGFDIGSHTRTHARLAQVSESAERLREEVEGSKLELEQRLGVPCRYISWPYGGLHDADRASLEMVERAGYRACFGAYRGSVLPGVTSAYSVPRHHFEPQWPISHVRFFAAGGQEGPAR